MALPAALRTIRGNIVMRHEHSANKHVLDKLKDVDGKLTFNGQPVVDEDDVVGYAISMGMALRK